MYLHLWGSWMYEYLNSNPELQDIPEWADIIINVDDNNISFENIEVTIPQYSEPGTWTLREITANDAIGNNLYIERDYDGNYVTEGVDENGDYIYGKKRLREIDSRVRFLQKRLDELQVVDTKPSDTNRIFFGCRIGLEDEEGLAHNYRIVGPDEFDLNQGLLSCDSPLGRALLGKSAGDTVYLKTPEGETEWYIDSITYE